MSAGYSGTPLARKLGIREGHRVATLGGPEHFPGLLDLPDDVTLDSDPARPGDFDHPAARSMDVVILFAASVAVLEEGLPVARRLVAWDGGLWIAWPKGSSPLASDIGKGDVRRAGLSTGMVDNKVCAVDEDWSGLRFVHRVEDRP